MKIRELLNDESKWTKQYNARNSNRQTTLATNKDAVCWCLEGALLKCYPDKCDFVKNYNKLMEEVIYPITSWNDNPKRTFEDVKNLIDKLDI